LSQADGFAVVGGKNDGKAVGLGKGAKAGLYRPGVE
jgi:hypothetical protein